MASIHETNWEIIVSNDELTKVSTTRLKEFIEISIDNSQIDNYVNSGWKLKNKTKEKAQCIKKKSRRCL